MSINIKTQYCLNANVSRLFDIIIMIIIASDRKTYCIKYVITIIIIMIGNYCHVKVKAWSPNSIVLGATTVIIINVLMLNVKITVY